MRISSTEESTLPVISPPTDISLDTINFYQVSTSDNIVKTDKGHTILVGMTESDMKVLESNLEKIISQLQEYSARLKEANRVNR